MRISTPIFTLFICLSVVLNAQSPPQANLCFEREGTLLSLHLSLDQEFGDFISWLSGTIVSSSPGVQFSNFKAGNDSLFQIFPVGETKDSIQMSFQRFVALGIASLNDLDTSLAANEYLRLFSVEVSDSTAQFSLLNQDWKDNNTYGFYPELNGERIEYVLSDSCFEPEIPIVPPAASVFPNPTEDILQVYFESEPSLELVNSVLHMYDLLGRKMPLNLQGDINGNVIELDLSTYPVGIYYLDFRLQDASVTYKIFKK
ncbi:MAG: T9SS type A sorting domain-containing protein [Bacteroidota bacterium]